MKDHIATSIEILNKENIFGDRMRWEFLKFEIRKLSIYYSICKTRERKGKRIVFENKIKLFEQDLEENGHNQEYLDCKQKLNDIFDRNVKGVKIRSNCKWYKKREKK